MSTKKIEPYQPCPCGSGRKYKFCCHAKGVQISQQTARALVHQSADFPVAHCWVDPSWKTHGLASVFVSRQLPNGKLVIGVYLVDTLCMGVKSTFCNANLSVVEVQKMLSANPVPVEPIEYEDARSLVLGGLEYARSVGFEPDPSWKDSRYVIEADKPFAAKYEFGQDGRPVYISGPFDDPETFTDAQIEALQLGQQAQLKPKTP